MRIAIFGATSAIATSCARRWAVQGHSLALIGRDAAKLGVLGQDLEVRKASGQTIAIIAADLAELERHEQIIAGIYAALGGLDVILVAHGSLSPQSACEDSVDMTMREINLNALSPISIVTLVVKRFEA